MVAETLDDVLIPDDHYGVDVDGPVPEVQVNDAVVVNPPRVQLNAQQEMVLEHISDQISAVDDGHEGVLHYLQTLQLIESWSTNGPFTEH